MKVPLDNLDEILGSNDSSAVDLIKKLEYYNSIISAENLLFQVLCANSIQNGFPYGRETV